MYVSTPDTFILWVLGLATALWYFPTNTLVEGGREGQMEYPILISDHTFFISLILMYVIEHCHTIIQHPNIPQKYKTNAFEKIKSDSKHLQTLYFKVWDLDNLSKCE